MAETTFGQTFSSGIQDISAFLPLLGTDQCKVHVGSALDGGYLYAAASPLSMFGCLGIVQASLAIFFASLSARMATMVRDAGFALEGTTASMIGRTRGGGPMDFRAEARFIEMRKKYHIENADLDVTQSFRWNAFLITTTFFLSLLGITPYFPIILSDRKTSPVTVWLYPLLRITGSAVCVVAAQIAVQCRIVIILRSNGQISGGDSLTDREKGITSQSRRPERERKRERDTLYLLLSQLFLVMGIGATVVGYLGCFTLVQNTKSLNAILWLSFEATLCVLRVMIWAANPFWDEDTKVTITFHRRVDIREIPKPFPNQDCDVSYDTDSRERREPFLVVDDHDFLEHVTPYIGPFERFTDSKHQIAIYYCLFRGETKFNDQSPPSEYLLTTILDVETRECSVLENFPRPTIPRLYPSLTAYAASLTLVQNTGVQVRYSGKSLVSSEYKQSNRLDSVHEHSQLLIDRIVGMDRTDSLQVYWSFRSSVVSASDTLADELALLEYRRMRESVELMQRQILDKLLAKRLSEAGDETRSSNHDEHSVDAASTEMLSPSSHPPPTSNSHPPTSRDVL